MHVTDVARANVVALDRRRSRPGAYNVASGERHTVLDMAQAIADGHPVGGAGTRGRAPVPPRRRSPRVRRHGGARRSLGFVAETPFAAGMREFATAPLRHPAGGPAPNAIHGDGSRTFNVDDGSPTTIRVEIDGLTLKGGDVTGSGGAILNREDLLLKRCFISGNTASMNGGGIYSQLGSLEIDSSTLQTNRATGNGGQIWLDTALSETSVISNSTMVASPPSGQGSALYVSNGLTRINNCTFSGSIVGALVYLNASDNNVTLSSCTLSCIGSVDIVATHIQTLRNTIVSANVSLGTGLSGSFNADYCIINKVGTATINGSNNVLNQSAGLVQFADYGGQTQLIGLVADSPAINAGDPTAIAGVDDTPLFDQRGANYSRVAGGRIDIGAYEFQNTGGPLPLVVDTTSDDLDYDVSAGHLSLREAISLANANAGFSDTITFAQT